MIRTTPEWIGKTDDTPVPPHVRLRIFERFGGICCECTIKIVGLCPRNSFVLEAPGTADLSFCQPIEQHREIVLRLARKTDDERRSDGEIGADIAPAADALRRLLL